MKTLIVAAAAFATGFALACRLGPAKQVHTVTFDLGGRKLAGILNLEADRLGRVKRP